MTPYRAFFFACKPGCDPVQVSGKTAHSRLPWVAQGYEVFEWIWVDGVHWAGMIEVECDRLYEFCGTSRRTSAWPSINPATAIQRKAEAIIYERASFCAAV